MIYAALKSLFRRLSISAKLMTITVGVTTLSVLVGAGLIFAIRADALLENELTRMRHIVAIAADFSQGPLSFGDQRGAEERLAYLQTVPEALQAYVLNERGEIFAHWRKHPQDGIDWTYERHLPIGLTHYYYTLDREIRNRDVVLGRLVVLAGTRLLRTQIFQYLTALLTVAAIIIPLAAILVARLQRAVSGPVKYLAQVAQRVSSEADYGLRVTPQSNDEIAELYHAFNDMMRYIQAREGERDRAYADLQEIREQLEDRVAQRTKQYQAANQALAVEIAKLRQAETIISRALSEKETLLREIHHRVKNNLQVIYSLLSLQMEGNSGAAYEGVLEDARQRVKTMALVHETLYGSKDLANVVANDFVESIVQSLGSVYEAQQKGIVLTVKTDDLELDIDQAIPLGLIINELATNALKYAFTDGSPGNVEVSLRRASGDRLVLQVCDDGVGFAEPPDLNRASSLGLRLVHALSLQLQGQIAFTSREGTRFELTFPRNR